MRVAALNQAVNPCFVSPGFWPPCIGFGTGGNGAGEGGICRDTEAIPPHGAGECAGEVETIQRQNCALARFNPIDVRIITRISHGEQAAGIGGEQGSGVYDRFIRHGLAAGPFCSAIMAGN